MPEGGHLRRGAVHGALPLDVANDDGAARKERLERLAARVRAHAVDDQRPLVLERLSDRPRDASPVGDAEDEEGLLLEAEEAHGASSSLLQATE